MGDNSKVPANWEPVLTKIKNTTKKSRWVSFFKYPNRRERVFWRFSAFEIPLWAHQALRALLVLALGTHSLLLRTVDLLIDRVGIH